MIIIGAIIVIIILSTYIVIDKKRNKDRFRNTTVEVEKLLGRDEIQLDSDEIEEYLTGKRIVITGGGGSIGSELCRQIAKFNPEKILIVDIYENTAYCLLNEIKRKHKELNIEVSIASIRDKKRMNQIFKSYKPQVVFHAAAHKHVPLMERSPMEAIKNNIFGTYNIVNAADESGVERFVLISTDKAVNPTNIMGATKRMCEMLVQAKDMISSTKYVAVRFGNVLGSNGSVVPLFKKQIREGGPVTVTHKEITRFFMTVSEAAQLVLQAGAYAKGGEIFVLDMGKPVKIYEFAENLIKLMGYEPHKEIKIEITGLRPGEKLYEELLMNEEGLKVTGNKKIFIARPGKYNMGDIAVKLNLLKLACDSNDHAKCYQALKSAVKTFKSDKDREIEKAKEKRQNIEASAS